MQLLFVLHFCVIFFQIEHEIVTTTTTNKSSKDCVPRKCTSNDSHSVKKILNTTVNS